jgi:glycerophosphoryl diester phosphodiesterase
MIKKQFLLFLGICFAQILQAQTISGTKKVDALLKTLNTPMSKNVMVIAHRGDWRSAPENSLQAIKNVIEMGVDMVEIDIQKTKDGELVLMHDTKLDRTTTGKGKVSDFTLEEIKKMYLRNGAGVPTSHRIPTLEEALNACKGNILVNIDKGYNHFKEAYEVVKKTGTSKQVVIKGGKTYGQVLSEHGDILSSVIYMPVVNITKPGAKEVISDFSKQLKPVAFELVFNTDTISMLKDLSFIRKSGSKIWINTLWPSLNGGHHDDMAVEENKAEQSWGWVINKGATMIQTDRPKELIEYLRKKGLHN